MQFLKHYIRKLDNFYSSLSFSLALCHFRKWRPCKFSLDMIPKCSYTFGHLVDGLASKNLSANSLRLVATVFAPISFDVLSRRTSFVSLIINCSDSVAAHFQVDSIYLLNENQYLIFYFVSFCWIKGINNCCSKWLSQQNRKCLLSREVSS